MISNDTCSKPEQVSDRCSESETYLFGIRDVPVRNFNPRPIYYLFGVFVDNENRPSKILY
jgi:hypothetical protein